MSALNDTDATLREMRETAARALDAAKRAGADAADVLVSGGESIGIGVREGAPEHLERSDGALLGLRVFRGRRQAIVSVGDPARADLAEAAQRAVDMAGAAPEDPWAGLAEPGQIARRWPDPDLMDDFSIGEKALEEMALACEEAALATPGVRMSAGAEASASRTFVFLAASNGFSGGYGRTSYSVAVSAIAGEGADMQRDYEYDARLHLADLRDPAAVGRKAGERAVRRLRPQKPASLTNAPVIFEQRVAGSLAGHLAAAVNGRAIARGASFLKEKMGAAIMAEGVRVIDDPLMPRGLASRPFDGEGLAGERLEIVSGGVLRRWLLDLASARQLGLESNGRAARSPGAPPAPASTNFHIAAGTHTPEELIASVREGLFVTELIGMGVNPVTGDYSRGATGFRIENGEITHPVSEVTIAGNLADMFARLTPADDLEFRASSCAPTCLIGGMTIAGR